MACGSDLVQLFGPGLMGAHLRCQANDPNLSYTLGGYYYLSADGGKSWSSWPAPEYATFINGIQGWQIVSSGSAQPFQLQRTIDGGRSWMNVTTMDWSGPLDFLNQKDGWVIAHLGNAIGMVHTANGGATWTLLKPVVK